MSSKKNIWASGLFLVACMGVVTRAAETEKGMWMTDFAAAKAKAKAEKKLLLVDFTGSDWCGWCIKLRNEVFDLEPFKAEAPKKFVMVELDYPNQKELAPELKAQNEKLKQEYKIRGFPTIYVMDAEGKPVAKTGYQAGGPEKYLEHLDGFSKAHETVLALQAKLPATKGIDRAKTLDQILVAQESLGLDSEDSAAYSAEILTLDADGKAGLKSKYTIKKHLSEGAALAAAAKFTEAKAEYEKALAVPGITAEQKQDAYFAEGGVCFNQKDFSAVVDCLTKARDAAPTSPKSKQIGAMIARFQTMADAQAAVAKIKTQLEPTKGVERAKVLDQLVSAQTKFLTATQSRGKSTEIEQWAAEIITLDAENKAGLKTKYEAKALLTEASKELKAKDLAKAEAAVTKALALPGLTEEQKAPALKLKSDIEAQKSKSAPTK